VSVAAAATARQRPAQARRAVHGVLLLDKPLGCSSNDALQQARRLLRAEKAGHTGTLDPLASGLLPICLGAATKFSQVSLDADKAYRATLRLGRTTTTGDGEGQVLSDVPVQVDRAAIEAACARFVGPIDQTPPMHSALKHEGKALYEYARAGIEVAREARRVTIHSLDIVHWQDAELVLDVACSKGTYVRTLAQDLGAALGCGAHLSALRRTGSGGLGISDALTLEQLAGMSEAQRDAHLLPVDHLLAGWPEVRLAEAEAGRFLAGMRLRVSHEDAAAVRVYGPQQGAFLGSAHVRSGELIATRLLSPLEVNGMMES
jgi:tRNA pseudouridine55 synthase